MLLSLSLHIKIRGTHTNNVFPFLTVIFIALLFTKLHASIVYVFSVKLGTPLFQTSREGGEGPTQTPRQETCPQSQRGGRVSPTDSDETDGGRTKEWVVW